MNTRHQQRLALAALRSAFPTAFAATTSEVPPRPLAIGVAETLYAWADTQPVDITRTGVKKALQYYCGRDAYLAALARGEMRIGLDGVPVEPVTPEAAALADARLKQTIIERERTARKKAAQKERHLAAEAKRHAEAVARKAAKAAKPPKVKAAPVVAPKPAPVAKSSPAVIVKKRRVVIPPAA